MVTNAMDKGRQLEEHVAAYFRSHGYDVRRNHVLRGRSGAAHEIDVLAERSDPLTTVKIAIECKAWETAIEKDVVSKLDMELRDLGLNKGIIVSLSGHSTGAGSVARELNIDLWGPLELESHLGPTLLSDLRVGPATRPSVGFPYRVGEAPARRIVDRQTKGRLGLRAVEDVTWFAPVWLPAWLACLSVSEAGRRRGRTRHAARQVWNLYEAVTGAYLLPAAEPGRGVVPIDVAAGAVRPVVKETAIAQEIRREMERLRKLRSEVAVERHQEALAALGVPVPCVDVIVESTELVHLPAYLGFLRQRDEQRVVVVTGWAGQFAPHLSAILTSRMTHVRASLGPPAPRPIPR
ncbi:MAG TPA: restriction endonuclease [Acidimicrobiales bacterium]